MRILNQTCTTWTSLVLYESATRDSYFFQGEEPIKYCIVIRLLQLRREIALRSKSWTDRDSINANS
ncbi:hypothetical protein HJC23_009755 [Cyclotella cryptica]|uniref:Uncharacterized protein n=1 Tax=Cyclotella cryptica TaxID=29204 RepID=A0ABD3PRF4_9STRA